MKPGRSERRGAFETAIRIDPENVDAKYNLELLLRRRAAGRNGRRAGRRVGAPRQLAARCGLRHSGAGLLMLATSLTFASPAGAVLCGIALVPLGVLAVTLRRNRRAASVLGLAPAGSRPALPAALAAAGACALLGIAAAQPVLSDHDEPEAADRVGGVVRRRRVPLDGGRTEPRALDSRLERARATVRRLREAVPEVPAGISGLTDRVLPYLFATPDGRSSPRRSADRVGIQTPPPQQIAPVATSFSSPARARG